MNPEKSPKNERRDFSRGEEHGATRRARKERGGYFHRESPGLLAKIAQQKTPRQSASTQVDFESQNAVYRFLEDVGFSDEESDLIYESFGSRSIAAYAEFASADKNFVGDVNEAFLQFAFDNYDDVESSQENVWDKIQEAGDVYGIPARSNMESLQNIGTDDRKPLDEAYVGNAARLRTLGGVQNSAGLPGGYESDQLTKDLANDNNVRDL